MLNRVLRRVQMNTVFTLVFEKYKCSITFEKDMGVPVPVLMNTILPCRPPIWKIQQPFRSGISDVLFCFGCLFRLLNDICPPLKPSLDKLFVCVCRFFTRGINSRDFGGGGVGLIAINLVSAHLVKGGNNDRQIRRSL